MSIDLPSESGKRPLEQVESELGSTPASETGSKRPTPDPTAPTAPAAAAAGGGGGTTVSGGASKVPAHVLQRRREGRLRAMEKLQTKLDELGIRRTDQENNFKFSSIPTIQLINQKNYYTDYLKKDDQIRMVREMKERITEKRLAKKQAELEKKQQSQDVISKLKSGAASAGSTATSNNNSELEDENDNENDNDEDDDDEDVVQGSRTIVFHPGSSNIRIGLSTDVDPVVIPNLIAYKTETSIDVASTQDPAREIDANGDTRIIDPTYNAHRKTIVSNFKERMKYYKRRILPNSNETCFNYNKRVEPEQIKDHDDIHKEEYISKESVKGNYVIGEDVYRLEKLDDWLIRSPFLDGHFNDQDTSYRSPEEVLGDVELILMDALAKNFGITSKKALASHSCVLIIPNLFDKYYVEAMVDLLSRTVGFGQIAFFQEGLCATFGSGVSTACVVDIGATSTKVCCLEEGYIFPSSQITLSYGANDVTRLFMKNLLAQQFPYRGVNLNQLRDWRLANELKESYVTFNDANVAIQLFKFVNRQPGHLSEKYDFKCFDDVMVSPMGLFYPEIFKDELDSGDNNSIILGRISPRKKLSKRLFGRYGALDGLDFGVAESLAQESEISKRWIADMGLSELATHLLLNDVEPNLNTKKHHDVVSAQNSNDYRVNMTPLDRAIIESISYASFGDQQRLERMYANILVVGGGSKIEGLDTILTDRLHMNRSPVLASNKLGECTKMVAQWKAEFDANEANKDEVFSLTKQQIGELHSVINSSSVTPIEILSNSKEIDPSILVWKGGSVFARLKIIDELWITGSYWDMFGCRSLNYTSLFNY